MKTTILILITALFVNLASAQETKQFNVSITSKSIKINDYEITNKTSRAEIISLLGEPNRIKKNILDVEQNLIYDSLGLSIELDKETHLVAAISVNYNWDNDEKMAKLTFTGILKIDNLQINDATTTENIKKETTYKEIICLGEMLCMTQPGKEVLLVVGYNKDKKITQIGFALPK